MGQVDEGQVAVNGENCTINKFCGLLGESLAIGDDETIAPGPEIKGGTARHIACGGDDRLPAGDGRDLNRKFIAAAQVSGEQTDGELTFLIDHDDAGIRALVLQEWGNGTNNDAGRHNADDPLVFAPHLTDSLCYPGENGHDMAIRQLGGETFGQTFTFCGEGEYTYLHSAFIRKAGWSLCRR